MKASSRLRPLVNCHDVKLNIAEKDEPSGEFEAPPWTMKVFENGNSHVFMFT
jgi:hypothetical protein